jgi:alginate O-acetyltransferase complex protein AlgI
MLFNSYLFLLGFLPVTVIGFFVLSKRSETLGATWLASASLFFYGWWDYRYVPLLLASIFFNYWCGWRILQSKQESRKYWLIAAIVTNLALLAYYKYAGFFMSAFADLTGQELSVLNVVLPIGISFFTFTQIAFLVDTYQGKVKEARFIHYVLFVTYFPHLIAGPVLHHKEMMPQFGNRKIYLPSAENFAVGFTIFVIGLAKKVLIADNLAPYANSLFSQPDSPSLLLAWGGVLAYTFQLYFDFSGYSDMAIGLSRLFGIRLPLNFDSPYKAANISEFWRRWHMTLSRFLRDYLYIPLGGNRIGKARRYSNLMVTMVLGGLWHGAGWTYIVWGALHGLYLVIHHAWAALANYFRFPVQSAAWRLIATTITFIAVCFAWVFFRAPDMTTALTIIHGMFGGFGIGLPDTIGNRLGGFKRSLGNMGVNFYLGGTTQFVETWAWVVLASGIAFIFPNTQKITALFRPALDRRRVDANAGRAVSGWLIWIPSRRWAVLLSLLATASLLSLNRPSEFLYFQF